RPEDAAVFIGFARDLRTVIVLAAIDAPEPVAAPSARFNALPQIELLLRGRFSTSSRPFSSTSSAVATASAAFCASTSSALSRSIVVSYLPATGLTDWTIARSFSVTGPRRLHGGLISVL